MQRSVLDCGPACLATIVSFYEGTYGYDELSLSVLAQNGASFLGLSVTAKKYGLSCEAYTADIPNLKTIDKPTILHVVIRGQLQHFVVCFGFAKGEFIIGDPAQGIVHYTEAELDAIWQTKALLMLEPNEHFEKKKESAKKKTAWLRDILESDLPFLGIAVFLGIVTSLLSISTALFSQQLIDKIIPNQDFEKLYIGLSLLFLLLLIKGGLGWLRGYFLLWQSKEFNNRIINRFYSSLLFLPKYFFDSRKTGELVTRMNDTRRIQSVISTLAGSVMIDVLVVLVSTGFLFFYSVWIGVLALSASLGFLLLSFVLNGKIVKGQKAVMQAYAHNESNYIDTIQGVDVIKITGKQQTYSERTKAIYGKLQDETFSLGKIGLRYGLLAESIGVVLTIGVLLLMSQFVLNGDYKVGELVAVIGISGGIVPSLARLSMVNVQLQEAKVAFDRMYEFIKIKPEATEAEHKKENRIRFQSLEVKNISFRFAGRSLLLKNVSFELNKGEIITLLGESGMGKSTTLQIIQRFYEVESGAVLLNGQEAKSFPLGEWRAILGVVPQEIKIFNGSLLENICLDTPQSNAQAVVDFCMSYGFHPFFNSFPQSYATILGEGGINLSGGQLQLVALARALFSKPQLLILDEPTAAMDRNTEGFIMSLLHKLKEEMGILLVTHKINTARKSDRIYILDKGEIVSYGSHEDLLSEKNLYSDTWSDYR
ncbi:peptidase domain-containing ABC transporter [Cytophagales bacterium LB-30]|uniref:Peptidase domain-containing ABC transporter n=1 Tax=Shiella aurantiaca TaxID=3058365 RepID=A0ABT8F268_9BACT|nr:peptidase domain-containing ABC transporter [Shiella aurantiaca]MDN4164542.1 peptidase domain-containing ABC transporter [Shiella aurantiaca]